MSRADRKDRAARARTFDAQIIVRREARAAALERMSYGVAAAAVAAMTARAWRDMVAGAQRAEEADRG
jgi:hypothetical protein